MKHNNSFKYEYLPKKLINSLQSGIFQKIMKRDYRTENNFIKCVGIIHHYQIHVHPGIENYIPLGSAYWKKVFGGDYYIKVIKPLLNAGIIQSRDFGYRTFPDKNSIGKKGKQGGKVGIRYRINPELLVGESDIIYYHSEGRSILTAFERVHNDNQELTPLSITNKNFFVGIDIKEASSWINLHAEDICQKYMHPEYVDSMPDDYVIKCHENIDGVTFNDRYLSIKAAKKLAEQKQMNLFYYKDSFYIANAEKFVKNRVATMTYHYQREISKIFDLLLVDTRSDKTLRVYNNLTNFPSKILNFIKINNQPLFQFDLKTSQFLLFANILNTYLKGEIELFYNKLKHQQTKRYLKRLIKILDKRKNLLPNYGVDIYDRNSFVFSNSDVIQFIQDVFFDDFYYIVQKELKLNQRALAKQALFQIIFAPRIRKDVWVEKLFRKYPVVLSIISDFKQVDISKSTKKDGRKKQEYFNDFSIFLQCVEAEIYIDRILFPLRNKEIPCFTRHDSLVVAEEFQEEAGTFIINVFRELGFRYNYTPTDMSDGFDLEAIEDTDFFDWITQPSESEINFFEDGDLSFNPSSSVILDDDDYDELDDEQHEIIDNLNEIGIHPEYSSFMNISLLEDLTLLPLPIDEENILVDQIIASREREQLFMANTNELITNLMKRYCNSQLAN